MVFESANDITVEQLNTVLSQFDCPNLVDCTDEVDEDWLLWVVVEREDRRCKGTLTKGISCYETIDSQGIITRH
jgi:hypothetical protein